MLVREIEELVRNGMEWSGKEEGICMSPSNVIGLRNILEKVGQQARKGGTRKIVIFYCGGNKKVKPRVR